MASKLKNHGYTSRPSSLGHPDIRPIWEELDRRSAVVFVHPTHAVDINLPLVDYPHETTRTAVDLITTDTVRKHTNCKIILSHAGGTLPYLAMRPAVARKDCGLYNMTPEYFIESARMFYYDLALTDSEFALPLLRKFALPDHILYGNDFPYAPVSSIEFFSDSLAQARDLGNDTDKIKYGNALKLFPRLSAP